MAEDTLRYIKVDYASHKDALLQRVRSRWPGVWNDFLFNGNASFGMLMVDLMAWSTQTTAFLVNRLAGETATSTFTLRESAQRVGSLAGYQLRGATPATVQCQATLTSSLEDDVTIRDATLVRAGDGTTFEVNQDYTILAGNLTPVTPVITLSANESGPMVLATNVSVTNGSPYVDLIDGTIAIDQYVAANQSIQFTVPSHSTVYAITSIGSKDTSGVNNRLVIDPPFNDGTTTSGPQIGEAIVFDSRITLIQGQTITDKFQSPSLETPNYAIKLTQDAVINDSVGVKVNDITWKSVDSFFGSSSGDQVFLVKTLTNGTTIVQFPDGVFGSLVPTNATIVISYRVGGGSSGNIIKGAIDTSISGFVTGSENPVVILIKNSTDEGQGGLEPETVDEARTNIPFFIRTNDRAVTLDDYQTLAQHYSHPIHGSVAYARASTRTENSLLEGNLVFVYAWTKGANSALTPLSPPLKAALKDYLVSKGVGTDYPVVSDGTQRASPIALRVKVGDGFDLIETKDFVLTTINDAILALRPGSTIIYSDLIRSIADTFGVATVTMATPINDLIASNPNELFTQPDDNFTYTVDRVSTGTVIDDVDGDLLNIFTAQLPVSPITAWSVKLKMGNHDLTVIPDITPGFARLYRSGVLSTSSTFRSTVNMLTGRATLYVKGAQGDLTMSLITVQAYDRERVINLYIGYNGTNTQAKRREIRSAVRSWADGFGIGGAIYASEVSGVVVSKSNVKDVVSAVAGVTQVTRVALETPSSSDVKIAATQTELLKVGQVVLNNSSD